MSSYVPREERVRRQLYDPGDDDDTVIIRRNNPQAYHDDAGCFNLPENAVEVPRGGAKRRWLAPCGVCVLPDGWDDGEG